MKLSVKLLGSLSITMALLVGGNAFAQDGEAKGKGYEITKKSDHSDKGFSGSSTKAIMFLRNSRGDEISRELEFLTLEKENDDVGDKSLIRFRSPKDIEGTTLLSHSHILKADNQWLYLPALKRVKRVSSANKSGSFVGSEFAFEDFTVMELNKFSYEYLEETVIEGVVTHVIKRTPLYDKSGYTHQIVWIDDEKYQARKVEFYDRKSVLLKTLTLEDYRNYGTIWRAHNMTMKNHQSLKETEIKFEAYDFDVNLSESDFKQARLSRSR